MTSRWLLAGMAGCGQLWPGTQIGVEEDGPPCLHLGPVLVIDPTSIPDGFGQSAEVAFAAQLGTFDGFRYDPNEEPTTEAVRMVVTSLGGPIVLERFVALDGNGDLVCPDRFLQTVDVVLEGPPSLSFTGAVVLTVDEGGFAELRWEGDPGAVAAIPEPTFDIEAEEDVTVVIRAGRATDGPWWFEAGWGHEILSPEAGIGWTRETETVDWGRLDGRP